MSHGRLHLGVLSLAFALALVASMRAQNDDDFARRQYASGLTFMSKGQYAEGLKDFQSIVDSFPKSAVADDALLQIALYHLEVTHDLKAAQTANDKLLKEYLDSDSAPLGYVVDGRLKMAAGRTPASVDAALASFERVSRLFPGSEAVAAAQYYTGDAVQFTRGLTEASNYFRRVVLEFPRSIWSARATIALTTSLVQSDRAAGAFADLQHIRQAFSGTPEAATALNLNTLLYRLYVKPAAERYQFNGKYVGTEANHLRDVIGLVVDPAGRLLVGHHQGVSIFDASAQLVATIPSEDPSTFFVGESNKVVLVRKGAFNAEGAGPTFLSGNAGPGRQAAQVQEIPSIALLSTGERLIADHNDKLVLRAGIKGDVTGVFASIAARRIAVSRLDNVAMIDSNSKAIVVADSSGKTLSTIAAKTAAYQIQDPIDVAFDALGHLYVLDSGKPSIFVFSPTYKLMATIAPAAKEQVMLQKPRAIALDGAGRLYVFDEKSNRVQVLQ